MKLDIKKATTDVTVYVFVQNSSLTTGAGLTGLVFNSAGLVCYYVRPLGSATALTLATQTVTGAHSDGGFVEVDATNMPGVYRLDLSDAICATGVNSVVVMLNGATNMAPVLLEIQLVSYDPNDATALGLSLVPANVTQMAAGAVTATAIADGAIDRATFAADTGLQTIRSNTAQAGAAGTITLDASASASDDFYNGLIIVLTGGTGVGQSRLIRDYTGSSKVADITPNWVTNPDATSTFAILPHGRVSVAAWLESVVNALIAGRVDSNPGAIQNDVITAAAIAANAIGASELAADAVTEIQAGLSTLDAAGVRTAVGLAAANLDTQLSTIDNFIDTEIADIQARLPAALVGGRMDSSVGAMAAGVVTAAAVATNAIDADAIAADAVAEIQAGLSTLDAAGVRSAVGLAAANLDTQLTAIDDYLDTEVAAIKTKTDQLNFTGTDVKATLDGETVALTAGQLVVKKNTALSNFPFIMVDSTDHITLKSGLTVTAQRSIDGAAFAACANSPAEVGATGSYKINLAAADLNGDTIQLKFTGAGADTTMITVLTQA